MLSLEELGLDANNSAAIKIIVVLLAGLVYYCLYKTTLFVHRRLARRIARWQKLKVRSLKFQNHEILNGAEVTRIVLRSWNLVAYAINLLFLYLCLNVVFLYFPDTQSIATILLGSLWGAIKSVAIGIANYLPNVFFLLVIYYAAKILLRLTQHFFEGIEKEEIHISGFYSEWAQPTYKLVRMIIVVFMIILAFPYFPGSDSPAFQGVSIFLGVLVSLGSSGTVANIISGIMLTYMRAFNIGDRVKIADAEGDVVERSLFVTRVLTIKNVDIAIPNLMVLNNHIINYSTQADTTGITLHTTVTIGYDQPWDKIQTLLIEAAKKTEGVDKDSEPFVLQTKLDDFYVHYELNASTRTPKNMGVIYSDLHKNIFDVFHTAGVEIASPHISRLRDGNRPEIPEDYLPKDYKTGAFRIFPFGSGDK